MEEGKKWTSCGGVDSFARAQGVSVRAGVERQFLQFLTGSSW